MKLFQRISTGEGWMKIMGNCQIVGLTYEQGE